MGRGKLLLIIGVAGGALAALLVATAVTGTSGLISGAFGVARPAQSGFHPAACCGTGTEIPCEGQLNPLSSYCCWCGCYAGTVQKSGSTPQAVPCVLEAGTPYCGYCPPPCTGICPMAPPTAAAP